MLHLHLPRINFIFSLVAITVLSFFCIENTAARYDPYLSDPNTSFFGRLIILNDELETAGGQETAIQQTVLLEALLQPFDLRGSRPTPTNRVSLQPSNLPTASGSGTNISRDGSCIVGFQDSGFFTPFHAFRWNFGLRGKLRVQCDVFGDNFPNLEVFLTSPKSNFTALLIDGRTTGGRNFGPQTRLWGESRNHRIAGCYTAIELKPDDSFAQNYTAAPSEMP